MEIVAIVAGDKIGTKSVGSFAKQGASHRKEASLEVETISKNALHFANLLLRADDGCVIKTFR